MRNTNDLRLFKKRVSLFYLRILTYLKEIPDGGNKMLFGELL